jgi:uncharacterized membrane protein (Fun14 family)
MGLESDLFNLVSGSFGIGIPGILVMAFPLIVGIIIGYVLRKAIKIGLILLVVIFIATFFGFVSLANVEQGAKELVTKYGATAASYVAIFFGIVPLSIGLVVGIIIGFII